MDYNKLNLSNLPGGIYRISLRSSFSYNPKKEIYLGNGIFKKIDKNGIRR
jgi:hypothetical protein